MDKTLKQNIARYANDFIAESDYRSFDDFEDIVRLTREVNGEFNLPFEFNGVTGEDAYIYVTHWSPVLKRSVILDWDWQRSFENGSDFADEVEETWNEYERVRKLLEQIEE